MTFPLNITTATGPFYHYPDVNPAPEIKQKVTPATTSAESTVVTKRIKLEGTGSRGRIRTGDFDELTRSIIEETISIYRAQIGGVEPFPERTDDCDTEKQAWLEVCTGRNVRVELEEDMFKLVSDYSNSLLFARVISLYRLSVVLHKHEATPRLFPSRISYLHTTSTAMVKSTRPVTGWNKF